LRIAHKSAIITDMSQTADVVSALADVDDRHIAVQHGLRERKKQATRRALQEAALHLVAEHGLDRVTVDDIAAAADVAPRTFFNYFSSKEEALLARDPEKQARVVTELAARPAHEDPLTALHAVLVAQADDMAAQADHWRLRMRLVNDYPQLLPRHLAAFAEGERAMAEAVAIRTGISREDSLYPDLVAAVAIAAMRTAMHRWREAGGTRSLAAHIDEAFLGVSAGLPAPEATKRPQSKRRTGETT
jgi:AcrR family transcriptional regulator